MLTVPFENLDIPLGQSIVLALPSFYDKIVRHRRGGFCYELNSLFGWLLEQMGFRVVTLSARVFDKGQPGSEFGHMVLMIEDRLIADVGFGESFLEPLQLEMDTETIQQGSAYRLTGKGPEKILERRLASDWVSQYAFSLIPRRLADFTAMCQQHQTSATSIFTQKTVCSLATATGRITLSNNKLLKTTERGHEEQEVTEESEYRALLKTEFGIDLNAMLRVDRLMALGTPSVGGD
jgi:N-hydroxyarylamine O-acetyltransferase